MHIHTHLRECTHICIGRCMPPLPHAQIHLDTFPHTSTHNSLAHSFALPPAHSHTHTYHTHTHKHTHAVKPLHLSSHTCPPTDTHSHAQYLHTHSHTQVHTCSHTHSRAYTSYFQHGSLVQAVVQDRTPTPSIINWKRVVRCGIL